MASLTIGANQTNRTRGFMETGFKQDGLKIRINSPGADQYTKISYPVKYGVYSEIETENVVFQFNLNHEIVRARGKTASWIHPQEWLKRTMGNDWIYYSSGGYTGVFEAIGEYYLPNLQYPTNSVIGGAPFQTEAVDTIVSSWHTTVQSICNSANGAEERVKRFLHRAASVSPEALQQKGEALFPSQKERVTVLPPDARHVDYDVIPLNISTGCLYSCRFCRVKTGEDFKEKSRTAIKEQILGLKDLYGRDIINYNSLFLGQHDALNADKELILFAAAEAHRKFNFAASYMKGCHLFLFGSVDSLLNADADLFKKLNDLDFATYINIGLESADQKTLDLIGKPLTETKVRQAFQAIRDINGQYENIELTSNFLMDDTLPAGHTESFYRLARQGAATLHPKGCIYLSPLAVDKPSREKLFQFNRLKTISRFPTFLYIIQRL